jgi:hypothetical protein
MKLIAHRGNINGPNPDKENHYDYIKLALQLGYDVEIDVWFLDKKWYLGHDEPQHIVEYDFLKINGLWLHAKNGNALYHLLQDHNCNVFWHTNEDWVLTSKNYIWTYPDKLLYPNSICVMPELGYNGNLKVCYGICTDYPINYEEV